jgi:LmbE family N-acetylglucosaminyl deacetylase
MLMDMFAEMVGRTLVVAPHPDDEILGCGGTISRLTDAGAETFVAVVTEGKPPAYPVEFVTRVQQEARKAHALLGVKETFWLGMPAAALTETAHSALNSALYEIVTRLRPKTLIIPFVGDIHVDHQLVFTSSLVAARPHHEDYPELILAYETLSETNWNAPYLTPAFTPNFFVEISDQLERKLDAMRCFDSQIRGAPHERSIETLRALATLRGATVLKRAAEAFVLVRHVC